MCDKVIPNWRGDLAKSVKSQYEEAMGKDAVVDVGQDNALITNKIDDMLRREGVDVGQDYSVIMKEIDDKVAELNKMPMEAPINLLTIDGKAVEIKETAAGIFETKDAVKSAMTKFGDNYFANEPVKLIGAGGEVVEIQEVDLTDRVVDRVDAVVDECSKLIGDAVTCNSRKIREAISELIEGLAAIEHIQWNQITKAHIERFENGTFEEKIVGWRELIATPYAQLTEEMKEYDREWVYRGLNIIFRFMLDFNDIDTSMLDNDARHLFDAIHVKLQKWERVLADEAKN